MPHTVDEGRCRRLVEVSIDLIGYISTLDNPQSRFLLFALNFHTVEIQLLNALNFVFTSFYFGAYNNKYTKE